MRLHNLYYKWLNMKLSYRTLFPVMPSLNYVEFIRVKYDPNDVK